MILQAEKIAASKMGYKFVGDARRKKFDAFREQVKDLLLEVYARERKQSDSLRSQLSSNDQDYFD